MSALLVGQDSKLAIAHRDAVIDFFQNGVESFLNLRTSWELEWSLFAVLAVKRSQSIAQGAGAVEQADSRSCDVSTWNRQHGDSDNHRRPFKHFAPRVIAEGGHITRVKRGSDVETKRPQTHEECANGRYRSRLIAPLLFLGSSMLLIGDDESGYHSNYSAHGLHPRSPLRFVEFEVISQRNKASQDPDAEAKPSTPVPDKSFKGFHKGIIACTTH